MPRLNRAPAEQLPLYAALGKAIAAYFAKFLPSGVRSLYAIHHDDDERDIELPCIIISAADDGADLSGLEPHRLTIEISVRSSSDTSPSDHRSACGAIQHRLNTPEIIRDWINAATTRPVTGLHIYFLEGDITRHERTGEQRETTINAYAVAQSADFHTAP